MHPNLSLSQFLSLCHSIDEFGQQEPVKLYNGEIIDGRHRLKAMISLGQTTINAVNIVNKLTDIELQEYVINTDNRRHCTQTQKAILAYRYYVNALNVNIKTTQQDVARRFGIGIRILKQASSIGRLGREDILNSLIDGIYVSSPMDRNKKSNSIGTVLKWFQEYEKIKKIEPKGDKTMILTDKKEYLLDELFDSLIKDANGNSEIMKAYAKSFNYKHHIFQQDNLKYGLQKIS